VINIALHGLARSGKDEVGRILTHGYGYERIAMGDLIKAELNTTLLKTVNISAFTDDPIDKEVIRPLLVRYGYMHCARFQLIIQKRLQAGGPPLINTRIFRPEECQVWINGGGQVWEVVRPGTGAAEPNEARELERCRALGMITGVIPNSGTIDDLERWIAVWGATWMESGQR